MASAGPSPVRYGPGNWRKEGPSGTPTPGQPSARGGFHENPVSAASCLLFGAARAVEADLLGGSAMRPKSVSQGEK